MRPAPASASGPTASWMAPPPAASPWRSPVPYLFGGLAAMLGLIALALLILACSYWKLNRYLDADSSSPAADGSKSPAVAAAASPAALAGLVAVVMAGEKTPTFLAAPVVRRVADGAAGEGATETETKERSGIAGAEGSGGLVDDAGRDRQTDHV